MANGPQFLKPSELIDKLNLVEGMQVADLGCGNLGFFIIRGEEIEIGFAYGIRQVVDSHEPQNRRAGPQVAALPILEIDVVRDVVQQRAQQVALVGQSLFGVVLASAQGFDSVNLMPIEPRDAKSLKRLSQFRNKRLAQLAILSFPRKRTLYVNDLILVIRQLPYAVYECTEIH